MKKSAISYFFLFLTAICLLGFHSRPIQAGQISDNAMVIDLADGEYSIAVDCIGGQRKRQASLLLPSCSSKMPEHMCS